jgi:hypothetical protein
MSHYDALIPFRWAPFTEQVLPALRALVLVEDPRPVLELVNEALSHLPKRGDYWQGEARAQRPSGLIARSWFSLYALAPLAKDGSDDLRDFLAHLVSPHGRKDEWGDEYAGRIVQLFRGYRSDLSRRLAPAAWPAALESTPSPAAEEPLDELFAELVLFFASPREPGQGDFFQEPQHGLFSATLLELDGEPWHVRLAGSANGFSDLRGVCPALFGGTRRPPFSRDRSGSDTETLGPLYPSEVGPLATALATRKETSPTLNRVVQQAAEAGMALLTWRCGL